MLGFQDKVPWHPPATLPGALQRAGYQTAIVGRNMHQYAPDNHFGFEWIGGDYQRYVEDNQPHGGGGPRAHGIDSNGWAARPWHLPEHLHHTHWVINEALEFLRRRDAHRPFFLIISFVAPHPPLVPPAFYLERYLRMEMPGPTYGDWAVPPANDGLGLMPASTHVHLRGEALRSCLAGYYGLINHLDDQMHRIAMHGAYDKARTFTGWTSDHGEMLGDHYLFRKCYPYEGSARIPFFLRGPGIAGGQVSDVPVCLEDIMPTVLELADVPVPPSVQGASLVPLLRGEVTTLDRPYLCGEHATCYEPEQANHFLTDGREKYVWLSLTGTEHLFDLTVDPCETRDLARQPDAQDRLRVWRQRMIENLRGRPEGFTDGQRLIAGRPHQAVAAREEQCSV